MSKIIVVNNPAAKHGGVLTVLKEFLDKISSLKCNRQFLVFVSLEELKIYETSKVKINIIETQGFKERIMWDNFKLKKYLNKKQIKVDLFISLQNTGVNLDKNIPQILYYHQLLSVIDLKWNFFKKNERLYWVYKNIYPIFIKQHLSKVKKIIVQTEWVKDRFCKKFNYLKENIVVIRPKIENIDIKKIKKISKNKFLIFYPAAPLLYKNHKIILKALFLIKKKNPSLIKEVECIFTFNEGENLEFDELTKKYKLEETIKLVGRIPYSKVLEYYGASDLLVFPSYLETFGLPLLEAQKFDLDILTVDLPYSKEVMGKYKKCEFISCDNSNEWYEKIIYKIKVKL